MTLQDLPINMLYPFAFVIYLNCMAGIFCAVRAFGYPAVRKIFFLSTLAALINYLLSSALAICFIRIYKNSPYSDFNKAVLSLPVWAVGLCAAVTFIAVVVMFIRMERLIRRELSAQSVCMGMDQLPDGVCYSMPDGFPMLVNNQMQRISNAAFGVGVLDANKLSEQLASRELQPGCAVDERDGNVFLRLPDGSVWQIKKQTLTVENRGMTETIAYDVTQRYQDLLELEQRNVRLEEVNRQIKEYDRRMNRIVREKEILAAKIRLHGNLGQCLLAIQSYLTDGKESRESVTKELSNTVSLLRNNTVDEHTEDRLYALKEAAGAVGVEIGIHGDIPPRLKEIAEVAIHECLTNTVKHAGGRVLDVTVRQRENAVTLELTNDGTPPKGPINETGGLRNLRTLVESRGGEMTVAWEPAFRLTLRFV